MPVVGLDGEKVGGRAGSYGWETEETPKLDVPVGWFRRHPHTSRPTFLYSTHNKQNEIQTNIKKQLIMGNLIARERQQHKYYLQRYWLIL